MTDAKPYLKASQLARGERRYRRKVASPKQWAAIRSAKLRPCRLCGRSSGYTLTLHHLVPRDRHGDDVADNLVALCMDCHRYVEGGERDTLAALAASLTDAEYAYVVGKLGEGGMERLFGVGRS